MRAYLLGLVGGVVALFFSCGRVQERAETTTLIYPEHFPPPLRGFDDNPLTKEGIALGRMLFHDPELSEDGTVSCATCHLEQFYFADPGRSLSTLPDRDPPIRHTPALINLAWQPSFFWDGGVKNLESVSLGPLKGHREMNTPIETLAKRLRSKPQYRKMTRMAFGTDSLVTGHVFKALAQYMRSLVYTDTYFDAYKSGTYTPSEDALVGEALFLKHCAECHPPPHFTDYRFHNIGLDTITSGGDLNFLAGRARVTGDIQDAGKYKTPTLRYWMHTAPYMHDGSVRSIEDVFAHYRSGVQDVATLDSSLRPPNSKPGIPLSEEEVRLIKSFLSLLDSTKQP